MTIERVRPVEIELGKDGSKWEHGYIPLNPAAVALKNHHRPGGGGGNHSVPVRPEAAKHVRTVARGNSPQATDYEHGYALGAKHAEGRTTPVKYTGGGDFARGHAEGHNNAIATRRPVMGSPGAGRDYEAEYRQAAYDSHALGGVSRHAPSQDKMERILNDAEANGTPIHNKAIDLEEEGRQRYLAEKASRPVEKVKPAKAEKPSKMLSHEQIQELSRRREQLSRMNSIDNRATNRPDAAIAERKRELGRINRTLKAHYAERDAKQEADRRQAEYDARKAALDARPKLAEGEFVGGAGREHPLKVGGYASIQGQSNSKVKITGPKNILGKVPYETSFGTKGEEYAHKLVPYGHNTGPESPMGGRPVRNPQPGRTVAPGVSSARALAELNRRQRGK